MSFVGNLTYKGKLVSEMYNSGHGGDIEYRETDREKLDKFFEDLKTWSKAYGETFEHCLDEIWVAWHMYERPYGVTAESMFRKEQEELAS